MGLGNWSGGWTKNVVERSKGRAVGSRQPWNFIERQKLGFSPGFPLAAISRTRLLSRVPQENDHENAISHVQRCARDSLLVRVFPLFSDYFSPFFRLTPKGLLARIEILLFLTLNVVLGYAWPELSVKLWFLATEKRKHDLLKLVGAGGQTLTWWKRLVRSSETKGTRNRTTITKYWCAISLTRIWTYVLEFPPPKYSRQKSSLKKNRIINNF